jgi:HEAT repeats
MNPQHGKLLVGLVAILLVIGVTLLGRHWTQSESPQVQDDKVPNSLDVSAAPSPRGTSVNRLANSAVMDQAPPRPMADARGHRGSVEQAIDTVLAATNVETQIQAIRDLGNYQDPQALKVLGPALHFHAPAVRKAALEAMREGVQDPATLAEVRYKVTDDPDPEVRQAALEVLVRYDESPDARRVLEKLASEPRGAYRDFARRELDRMDHEADARSRPDPQLQAAQQLLDKAQGQ